MQHVIEACKSSIPREASFNNLIHTIGRVMIIIIYLKFYFSLFFILMALWCITPKDNVTTPRYNS